MITKRSGQLLWVDSPWGLVPPTFDVSPPRLSSSPRPWTFLFRGELQCLPKRCFKSYFHYLARQQALPTRVPSHLDLQPGQALAQGLHGARSSPAAAPGPTPGFPLTSVAATSELQRLRQQTIVSEPGANLPNSSCAAELLACFLCPLALSKFISTFEGKKNVRTCMGQGTDLEPPRFNLESQCLITESW